MNKKNEIFNNLIISNAQVLSWEIGTIVSVIHCTLKWKMMKVIQLFKFKKISYYHMSMKNES